MNDSSVTALYKKKCYDEKEDDSVFVCCSGCKMNSVMKIVKEMFKTARLVRYCALYLILCGTLFNIKPCYAAGGASKAVSWVVKGVMNAFKTKPPRQMWKSGDGPRTWTANPIAARALREMVKARQSEDHKDCEHGNMDASGDESVGNTRLETLLRQRPGGEKFVDAIRKDESSTVQVGTNGGDNKLMSYFVIVIIFVGLPCFILWRIVVSCSDDGDE